METFKIKGTVKVKSYDLGGDLVEEKTFYNIATKSFKDALIGSLIGEVSEIRYTKVGAGVGTSEPSILDEELEALLIKKFVQEVRIEKRAGARSNRIIIDAFIDANEGNHSSEKWYELGLYGTVDGTEMLLNRVKVDENKDIITSKNITWIIEIL